MSAQPPKVSIYSVNDLKNATDDFLPTYLTHLPPPYKFTQAHLTTDIRLALSTTAALLAGSLFYFDYKFGWDVTKPYTLPACIVYMLLNAALTYWIYFVEAGTIFSGVRAGGQKLVLKSSVVKHRPIYRLRVRYEAAQTGTVWEDRVVDGRFTEWFDVNGALQEKELRGWLAGSIEVLRLAESERARIKGIGRAEGAGSEGTPTATTEPVVAAGGPEMNSSTAKARKTRKKG